NIKKNISPMMVFTAIAAIIITIWSSFPDTVRSMYFTSYQKSGAVGELGTFGDSFGALNTLFSGLAFAGIILTVILQSKELRETREELKGQRGEFEKQNLQLRVQAFESIYLAMMSQKKDVTNDLQINQLGLANLYHEIRQAEKTSRQLDLHERDMFNFQSQAKQNYIYKITKKPSIKKINRSIELDEMIALDYIKNIDSIKVLSAKPLIREITTLFDYFYKESWDDFYENMLEDYFSAYFRICYQILKFIDDNSALKATYHDPNSSYTSIQKIYSDIFRSQLSSHELKIIFYNCLGKVGSRHFKQLAERYGLFEHLPFDPLSKKYDPHATFKEAYQYERSAFEKSEVWNKYFDEIEDPVKGRANRRKYRIKELSYKRHILKKTSYKRRNRQSTHSEILP
ncbi:MAG: putative phage abortive infection protein, partial [Pseudomonadota bacterium]|nr:putative phage abortive infection protein [Pseudomonadota bacterium]